jgi:uncharacterized membrane protein
MANKGEANMLVSSLWSDALDRLRPNLRRPLRHALSVIVGFFLVVAAQLNALAAETIFTSRAAFEASLGAFRTITFEPDQGFSGGLLPWFDEGRIQTRSQLGEYDGPASIVRYSGSANQVLVGNEVIGLQPNSNVRLLFSEPQFALGFDALGVRQSLVVDVNYLDNSTSQHIFDTSDEASDLFFGLRSDVGFRDVFIMGANRDDPNNPGEQPNHIDNLTLIPEPRSALLLFAGAMALVLAKRRLSLAVALILCCPALATAQAPHQFTSLGVEFFPQRISDSGQVVGHDRTNFTPALLWESGVFTDLGPGAAQDINDEGQILLSVPRVGDGRPTPAILQNGVTTRLPVPPWNGDFRHYYDMNASGHVVGQALERAFLWANGQLTYLDSTFGNLPSSSYAINDAGKVVGRAGNAGFLWEQGIVTLLPDTAMDINNRGQVLLMSSVWENGQVTPLPLLPLLPGSIPEATTFQAQAINERGQVVARQTEQYFIDPESGNGARYRNLLWDPVLGSQDLASLVGDEIKELDFALVTDINSAGQIVGVRENEAFLLTPVPEPSSVLLLVCAGILVVAVRWSTRRATVKAGRDR